MKESWKLPKGFQSQDPRQLAFWPDMTVEKIQEARHGRDDDAEASLWRALLGAGIETVAEDEQ